MFKTDLKFYVFSDVWCVVCWTESWQREVKCGDEEPVENKTDTLVSLTYQCTTFAGSHPKEKSVSSCRSRDSFFNGELVGFKEGTGYENPQGVMILPTHTMYYYKEKNLKMFIQFVLLDSSQNGSHLMTPWRKKKCSGSNLEPIGGSMVNELKQCSQHLEEQQNINLV